MNGKIVIGITGGIAAYKAANLCSMLKQKGYDLRIMMTKSATEFITPVTLQTFSSEPVITDMFEHSSPGVSHIDWADWADCVIIAPATANIIGKISNGIADDYVSTIIMATKAPVVIAPAMNVNMYNNPIVQNNLSNLIKYGYKIVEPEEGFLACGYKGKGRLATQEKIFTAMITAIQESKKNKANDQEYVPDVKVHDIDENKYNLDGLDFTDKNILITAGPTRETLDPVRYLSNHSSGKMGYAIAKAANACGANVTLIAGPTSIAQPTNVELINVVTAEEMLNAVLNNLSNKDIVIMAAAVADYRPVTISKQKIKKSDDNITIVLERNPDILQEIAKIKQPNQLIVGFAAESENLIENAKIKLKKKQLDLIIANDISKAEIGFHTDDNEVYILDNELQIEHIAKSNKLDIAYKILLKIQKML